MRGVRCVSQILLLSCLLLSTSCRHPQTPESQPDDVLISINGEHLTKNEVVGRIPVGIDASDSAALFEDIVDAWIAERVLSRLAESKLPDTEDIDRKVAAYRNRLIVKEYLQRMQAGKEINVPIDTIRKFYDSHKHELLTETPLVKGIFVSVPSNSPNIDEIRSLIAEGSEGSLDRLERQYGVEVLRYEFFENVWVDWQTIADMIPYRFYDPDAFLNVTRDFETTYNGITYLLHVSEYIASGSLQPFDFAKGRIEAMIKQTRLSSYEASLVRNLVAKAIKEGTLVRNTYDPLTHKLIKDGQ